MANNMYDLKILSQRLKATRTANNLTQRQLAEKANVTAATISAYEKGAKNPSLENVANLAFALNTSIDWLCGNEIKCMPKKYGEVITNLVGSLCFGVIEEFLDDLKKVKKLLGEERINESIFNSWLDGQIEKYSKIFKNRCVK